VAARQTCLCSDKCAELLRNDENILKSSAQTSLADVLNLSSKPSVFCPFIPLFGLLSPAAAVQPPALGTKRRSESFSFFCFQMMTIQRCWLYVAICGIEQTSSPISTHCPIGFASVIICLS